MLNKSNYISFFIQYNCYNPCSEYLFKIILEEENKDKETFFNTYGLKDIERFKEKYKYVNKVQKLMKPYFEIFQGNSISFEEFVEVYIHVALNDLFYQYNSQKNLDNYRNEFVYEEKHFYGVNDNLMRITLTVFRLLTKFIFANSLFLFSHF